jgi:hypothetical protein
MSVVALSSFDELRRELRRLLADDVITFKTWRVCKAVDDVAYWLEGDAGFLALVPAQRGAVARIRAFVRSVDHEFEV